MIPPEIFLPSVMNREKTTATTKRIAQRLVAS
jgi:hypothetical protein